MKIKIEILKELVKDVTFNLVRYIEEDNSITLSLDRFDLAVNSRDEDKAINDMVRNLREYALEYYNDIEFWSGDIRRKGQIKEILKVVITKDNEELKRSFRLENKNS